MSIQAVLKQLMKWIMKSIQYKASKVEECISQIYQYRHAFRLSTT